MHLPLWLTGGICALLVASGKTANLGAYTNADVSSENVMTTADPAIKHASWDVALYSAPKLVEALGQLTAASAETDFSLDTSTISGSGSVGYNRFRPLVIHIVNEAWKVTSSIEGNVQKTHLNAVQIPSSAKKCLQFLTIKEGVVAKKLASIPLAAMERAVTDISLTDNITSGGFDGLSSLLKAADEAIEETQSDTLRRSSETDIETARAKAKLQKMRDLCGIAEANYKARSAELDKARNRYSEALDIMSKQQSGEETDEKVTREEAERLRLAMTHAQERYEAAFNGYKETEEKLKNAEVADVGLTYNNKQLGVEVEVLVKSTQFVSEAMREAALFDEFFQSLRTVLNLRLKTSLQSAKQVLAKVTATDNPRESLMTNSELRQELVAELSKVANDSMIIATLTQAYGQVSDGYIVENLSKMVKLQDAEGTDLSERLAKFLSHIRSARAHVKDAIGGAVQQYLSFAKQWESEIDKILQGLRPPGLV